MAEMINTGRDTSNFRFVHMYLYLSIDFLWLFEPLLIEIPPRCGQKAVYKRLVPIATTFRARSSGRAPVLDYSLFIARSSGGYIAVLYILTASV